MGFLDDIFGGSDTSVSSTVTIAGLDNIKVTTLGDPQKPVTLNETIDIKPIELKPVTLNENIDIKPIELKPVTLNENIDIKPIELKPLTLNENIDLQPVAVDTCQTLRLAPLPDTSVCNPYTHRIAFGVLGFEVATVAFTGETEQQIRSPQRSVRTNRTRIEDPHPSRKPRVIGQPRGISIRVAEE
jgi:hypothetical protein